MHRWWVLLLGLLATASVGCNKKRTEIVIGMATDLKAPTPLKSIDFRVYKVPGDFLLAQNSIPVSANVDSPYVLPATWAVYSENGDADRFKVVLTATDNNGKTIIVRSAVMNLVPEKTLFVRLGTISSCMGKLDCGEGQTCIEGICTSDAVNSALLPAYTENMEAEVSCAGGTTFLNTATHQPFKMVGASCPGGGACLDGVCLSPEPEPEQPGPITITEFPLPTANCEPEGIAKGSDGNIWFTERDGNKIGRITPSGAIREFPIPTASAWSEVIAAGPDGRLWFTQSEGNSIGAITTAGEITEYPLPDTVISAWGITAGPDGALWFTAIGDPRDPSSPDWAAWGVPTIGRITTSGVVTTFPFRAPKADGGASDRGRPMLIAAGADAVLWFTFTVNNIFGRITTKGEITLFPLPELGPSPNGGVPEATFGAIAEGPDRNMWLTQTMLYSLRTGRILKANSSGEVTEYPSGTSQYPAGITAGPDGKLWFAEGGNYGEGRLGRITTAGALTEISVPGGGAPHLVALGADGNIWFTDPGTNSIGRVNLNASSPGRTDGGISGSSGGASGKSGSSGQVDAGGRGGADAGTADGAVDAVGASGKSGSSGQVDAGGRGSADAGTADGAGDTGACALPACLAILSAQCTGSGACVQQSVTAGTSTTLSVCYANGVKERTFIDTSTTVPTVVSVSQNGAACYSVEAVTSAGGQPQTLLTFKDNLGATIATGARDSTSGAATITCVGQAPVHLGAGCPVGASPAQLDGGTGACTIGSCS